MSLVCCCGYDGSHCTRADRLARKGSNRPASRARALGQIHSHNPITLTFHEWRDMWTDVFRDRDIRYLWKPPEWRSPHARPIAMVYGFERSP